LELTLFGRILRNRNLWMNPIFLLIWQFAGAFMAQKRCTGLDSAARFP